MSKRRRARIPPPPETIDEFLEALPKTLYKQTIHGLPFFSAQIKVNDATTVIFISPATSTITKQVTELQIGVTNQVVPHLFQYFCTIHAIAHNSAFPFVFALMTTNGLPEFNHLFQHLLNVLPDLEPSHICTDYNDNLQTSCSRIFPKAVISGSYYYYGQEVWREVTLLGLLPTYRSQEPVRRIIGMCLALALLPAHLLVQGLEVIRSHIGSMVMDDTLQTELYKLADYMENEWLSKSTKVSVFGQENRTSNFTHNFHLLLKKKFGKEVPPIWRFLEKLREIEEQQAKDLERMQHGKAVKRLKRYTHILRQRSISQAGDKLLRGKSSVTEYLEMVAEALPDPTDDEIYGLNWIIQVEECSQFEDSYEVLLTNDKNEGHSENASFIIQEQIATADNPDETAENPDTTVAEESATEDNPNTSVTNA